MPSVEEPSAVEPVETIAGLSKPPRPEVALIWAQAHDGGGRPVIGAAGAIPWHVPEDFAHFKRLTGGHPIIMGRRTWDSLPRKPLPNRTNIVLTRHGLDSATPLRSAQNDSVGAPNSLPNPTSFCAKSQNLENSIYATAYAADIDQAIALASQAPGGEEVWVIGGATVYAQALDIADRLEVTEIDLEVGGDTFAPAVPPSFIEQGPSQWQISKNGTRFRFRSYRRRP